LENEDATIQKWVLIVSIGAGGVLGSATQYFVGEFDGIAFTNSHYPESIRWIDHGRDNYAGVTWSGIPDQDDRTIFLGWMSNWDYAQVVPTDMWRSTMTIPREISLFKTPNGTRVKSYPVEETTLLRTHSMDLDRVLVNGETNWSRFLEEGSHRLEMELLISRIVEKGSWEIDFSNAAGESLKFGYNDPQKIIYVDRTNAGISDFHNKFAARHEAPRFSRNDQMGIRVFVDESSIEFFADMGEVVFTDMFFPSEPYNQLTFRTLDEEVVVEGRFYHLKSIWRDE